jgi:hypothetical protein
VRRDALKEEKRETMEGREALLERKGKKERRGKVKGGKFFYRNAATGSRSIQVGLALHRQRHSESLELATRQDR